MGLCPIWPLGQRTLPGTGPFSPLVGQRLCAVGAATGALGRCALEKGRLVLFVARVCFGERGDAFVEPVRMEHPAGTSPTDRVEPNPKMLKLVALTQNGPALTALIV